MMEAMQISASKATAKRMEDSSSTKRAQARCVRVPRRDRLMPAWVKSGAAGLGVVVTGMNEGLGQSWRRPLNG